MQKDKIFLFYAEEPKIQVFLTGSLRSQKPLSIKLILVE